jgi:phenolic acid decarboxylase
MKKLIIIIVLTTLAVFETNACDVCGCGVSGGGFGILPQFQKSFIATRWQQSSFQSEHLPLFQNEIPPLSNEYMNQMEIWGRYVLNDKIHFFGNLPYRWNQKEENSESWVNQGLGDISIQLNYIFFNNAKDGSIIWKQALQGGLGIKLPTGSFDAEYPYSGELIQNMQIGSGSVDIPFNLIYTLRNENIGLNFENSFRLNTTNKYQYKFGNMLQQGLRFFLWKNLKEFTFLPQVGVGHDFINYAKEFDTRVNFTKMQQVNVIGGLDIYYKKWVIQTAGHFPIYQNAGDGQVTIYPRFNVGLSYLISKK